jgi:diacylglycerol O-acyltransferase / wax synthase
MLRSCISRTRWQQLDRAKPLWDLWIAEGLDQARWALVSKSDHCMIDGVSATDLLSVLLDSEREPGPAAGDAWKPEPEHPSGLRRLRRQCRGALGGGKPPVKRWQ